MEINLRCRLRAYAKLSVGGGSSEDDSLKKILSKQTDQITYLGYEDVETGNKVYGIRRHENYDFLYGWNYEVILGENIGDVFLINEQLTIEGKKYIYSLVGGNLEGFDISPLRIENGELKFYIRRTEDEEYQKNIGFDIYFIFTGTDYEVSNIGEFAINGYRVDD